MEITPTYYSKNGNGKHRKPYTPALILETVTGRVPPHDLALEQAVLGAAMIDREALPVIIDILRPESFYREAHATIYRACRVLYEKSEPVDQLTVTQQLRASGELDAVGGSPYISDLTRMVASGANIEYHARIIVQKALQRDMIALGQLTAQRGYDDEQDAFGLLSDLQQAAFDLGHFTQKTATHLGRIGVQVLRNLTDAMQRPDGVTGVPSGIADLDKATGGWQDTDLVIIAGRPGSGKTSCVLCCALNAAKRGIPVAFFSLEMSAVQLGLRAASSETGIDSRNIKNGRITEDELRRIDECVRGFGNIPVFIDDTPGMTVFELRAKARKLVAKSGVQLIIIDYLQLMTGPNDGRGNREQEVSAISRGLKNLAKELKVPVIALSQLSRAVETRGGSKRPMLSDLRDSGGIEADADLVAFIYRPEYYGIMFDENNRSLKGVAEFIIAKHRHGGLDTVEMTFVEQTTKFTDLIELPATNTQFPATRPTPAAPMPVNRVEPDDSDPIPF